MDATKRRTVMQRSMRLGHCICNPKRACPCEVFRERNVCLCAGERLEEASETVRLTEFVENPGCASKIGQTDLKRVLAAVPDIANERVLVGTSACDDAGVFVLDEDTLLVQSVDVFAPSVDDPYTFGQIAAANSLSDIYAMGGEPLTALAVIGFPIETVSHRVMSQIIRGGMEKMAEAGVAVIGGHSLKDEAMKFGFAVTGTVERDRMVTNDRARPGDVLVLTKPLGVGILAFAGQLGKAPEAGLAQAVASMATLNRAAAEVMARHGIVAATDVTGFGLLGHLSEMVQQSGVSVEVWADRLPIFDGVLDCVARDMISGAVERNREYAEDVVSVCQRVDEQILHVLYDPQTSGGLLMAVPEEKLEAVLEDLHEAGVAEAAAVGEVVGASEGAIRVCLSDAAGGGQAVGARARQAQPVRESPLPVTVGKVADEEPCCPELEEVEEPCCAEDFAAAGAAEAEEPCCAEEFAAAGAVEAEEPCCAEAFAAAAEAAEPCYAEADAGARSAGKAGERFRAFMGAVNAGGALARRDRELLSLALSLLARCERCAKTHLSRAREAGVSQAQIEEAVWLAVAYGGMPVYMFYNSVRGGA